MSDTSAMTSGLEPALARFVDFYVTFSPEWLPRLAEIYGDGFVFLDPFGEIRGDHAKLTTHFGKMFKLHASSFVVEDVAVGKDGAYVRWIWDWQWKAKSPRKRVPGVTHLRLGADGRVVFHQDLFDAAEGFFDVVPVVGAMIRAVKKRM